MGHARSLLALPDHEVMNQAAESAIKNGLSVRALEAQVKELLAATTGTSTDKPKPNQKTKAGRPVWLNELEETLVETLSTPIAIKYGRKRSQIVIECGNQAELDRIFNRLKNA